MLQLIRNSIRTFLKRKNELEIGDQQFVIVADNCWGAEVYKEFNHPYNTPFVGLFLHSPCFLRLVENFTHYIDQPLQFVTSSQYPIENLNYPVGILGEDIEIHFLHYKDENEAFKKWNRRLERMKLLTDLDKYFFKISAESNSEQEIITLLDRFYSLPFKNKLSFSLINYKKNNHICIEQDKMPDGLTLYGISRVQFKMKHWLITGKVQKTFWNSFLARI